MADFSRRRARLAGLLRVAQTVLWLLASLLHPGRMRAQTAPAPNDYSQPANWLCRPGHNGPCAVDLASTVISADGKFRREEWHANAAAPIDCFYVYPTVSSDTTPNSDMVPDTPEIRVAKLQFERFGSVCRLYAPLYRQLTIPALLKRMRGDPSGVDWDAVEALARRDVADAWHYYLEHDNHGRGVVLIGHSQGAFIITDLVKAEIDGAPVQSRIVSVILAGATIMVPKGKDVGGTFQKMPLCHAATQTGCVIIFATFRATAPPPPGAYFGVVRTPGMISACTNPAALGGGEGTLHSYFDTPGVTTSFQARPWPWVTPMRPIPTPFVSVPGLLSAKCASNEVSSGYLEIRAHGNPADPRADDIGGDISPPWGLHLMDMPLTMGNLVEIVGRQGAAFGKRPRP